ncbi:MAG: hypothetical protein ACSHWY_03490 [Octadecabacter sp.]
MSKIIGLVVVIVVGVGGYFGLTAAGIIGAPAVLSSEEVEAGLASYADQINVEGGLRFDDFSRLSRATAMSQTITIRGDSLLDQADMSEGYYQSRVDQAANKLCNDSTLRELLRGRATVQFSWFSADDEMIGDMIVIRGDEVCAPFE